MEVSRSGAGAHVWTFFTEPVAAVTARTLGMALLRRAIDVRKQMTLSSYDTLFPVHDLLPRNAKGNTRFGSLIALPLQGASCLKGTTVFRDPHSWEPYPDQFAHLPQAERLSPAQVEALVDKLGEVKAGPSATAPVLPPKPWRRALGKATEVEARLSAMLAISIKGQPAALLAALKHTASFHNPEFYRRQSQRYSTWDTPRLVCSFDATDPDWLGLPRGLRYEAAQLIAPPAAHSRSPANLRTPR